MKDTANNEKQRTRNMNFVLQTQEEVDDYNADVTEPNNLTIASSGPDPIVNLNKLSDITSVGGDLIIFDNATLVSVNGLP